MKGTILLHFSYAMRTWVLRRLCETNVFEIPVIVCDKGMKEETWPKGDRYKGGLHQFTTSDKFP